MPETKALIIILQIIGWSTWVGAAIDNLGNIKSFVLFGLGVAFAIMKVADKVLDFKKKRWITTNTSVGLLRNVRGGSNRTGAHPTITMKSRVV